MTQLPAISIAIDCADRPVVMILGEQHRAEMRRLMDWLDRNICPIARRVVATDIPRALNMAAGDLFPNLIIVFQSWSDEYSSDDINKLLAFAPLARIAVCYGAWCESDGRNHNQWPLSVRVPLWAAEQRIEREWGLIQNPGTLQPLPWSASRDETFAADHPPIEQAVAPYAFLIDTPDPAYRQSIIEIMTEAGCDLARDHPDVLLVDLDPWSESRAAALRGLVDRYPRATVVALADLLLPSTADELRKFGVTRFSHKLGFVPPPV